MKAFRLAITPFLLAATSAVLRPETPASAPERIEITPRLLDRLVGEAQAGNPALAAAGARSEAASADIAAVRTWEDPTASFGVWGSTPRGMPASQEGNLIYGLDQKLPLYGRPELQRKVAAAEAARARLDGDFAAQALRRDLQLALDGQALAGREAEIAEEDLGWLDATAAAVDHRYRVGQASQVDWLKVQTERALAGDDLTTKEQACAHGAFALNRLLNRELHAPWPPVALPPLEPALYESPRLVAAALAAEPRLKVIWQESAAAQAAADLTRRQRLPDVSVGIAARQYSGDGGIREGMATVSVSLPWFNHAKYASDWRRDRERKRASDLDAADYALSVREELHHHLTALDAARRQAVLYRDQVIPLTRQTLASAEAGWERSVGPFQDILDAHRLLLADEAALARALTDQDMLLAEIGYLTGSQDAADLVALGGDSASAHAVHPTPSAP
jgi:outer membrane protein TolC